MLFMAARSPKSYTDARDIADQLDIPFHPLAKIFQGLARRGVLRSRKGPQGGFVLSRDPSEVRLIDIVETIDGLKRMDTCLLGMPECSDRHPCPAHQDWKLLREELKTLLTSKSLGDLAKRMQGNRTTVIPQMNGLLSGEIIQGDAS